MPAESKRTREDSVAGSRGNSSSPRRTGANRQRKSNANSPRSDSANSPRRQAHRSYDGDLVHTVDKLGEPQCDANLAVNQCAGTCYLVAGITLCRKIPFIYHRLSDRDPCDIKGYTARALNNVCPTGVGHEYACEMSPRCLQETYRKMTTSQNAVQPPGSPPLETQLTGKEGVFSYYLYAVLQNSPELANFEVYKYSVPQISKPSRLLGGPYDNPTKAGDVFLFNLQDLKDLKHDVVYILNNTVRMFHGPSSMEHEFYSDLNRMIEMTGNAIQGGAV